MGTIERRVARLEAREATGAVMVTIDTCGPPMTPGEIDAYNRRRRPDQPVLVTICFDRLRDIPIATGDAG